MSKGIYAGSFDPITNGHLWMIEQGSKLFNELVVSIGLNPDKKSTFSLEERLYMLKKATRDFENVTIGSFENQFLVNYAHSIGGEFILRGIRAEGDYEYERAMRHVNSDLNPEITTTFLMPPREIAEVSSSLVKGLIGPEGWENVIEGYVPRDVYNKFLVKFKGMQRRWNSLWEKIGAKGNPEESYDKLVNLYGESHRVYHNLVHIVHSLREFEEVRDLSESPEAIEIAIWFHDAIYNTHAEDNEERSAEFASEVLSSAEVGEDFINKVYNLVLATKHRETPEDYDAQLLVDIDLAIIGKEAFFDTRGYIREEYSWVPEEVFRIKRSVFFQRLLDRPHLYTTDFFREKYEKKARENIKEEIAQLS